MLKRLLLITSLVCVLTASTFAGDTNNPGAQPTPTPCPPTLVCPDEPGDGNSAVITEAESGSLSVEIVSVLLNILSVTL